MRYECDTCGLNASGLPDGVNLEMIFEREADGLTTCAGCRGGSVIW